MAKEKKKKKDVSLKKEHKSEKGGLTEMHRKVEKKQRIVRVSEGVLGLLEEAAQRTATSTQTKLDRIQKELNQIHARRTGTKG